MATYYMITRFHADHNVPNRIILFGLTHEEAHDWCNDPETSSSSATGVLATKYTSMVGQWFDGMESYDDDDYDDFDDSLKDLTPEDLYATWDIDT